MACPYARFVIYYDDGTQLVEDRNDPLSWDNAPKEGIWDMGILFDPQPLYFPTAKDVRNKNKPMPIRDPVTGVHQKEVYEIHKLKGERDIYLQWFRMIDFDRTLRLSDGKKVGKTLSLMIGNVYNSAGDCVIMFGKQNRQCVTFRSNLFKLKADINSIKEMKIDLNICGVERDTRQLMMKPQELIAEEQV